MTALENPLLSRVVSISDAAKRPMSTSKNDDVMAIVTPFDDDGYATDYKWADIRAKLDLNSNVANARWMPEKIMPIFAELEAPPLLTSKGRPTRFCAQMLFRYKVFCNDLKNDYELFAAQVKAAFVDDAPKAVKAEVLGLDDNDYEAASPSENPSSLARMQEAVEEREDGLENRIMRVMQAKQQASQALTKYQQLSSKSWEQQVIEDELAKIEAEERQKKREMELRLQVRQMAQKMGDTSGE